MIISTQETGRDGVAKISPMAYWCRLVPTLESCRSCFMVVASLLLLPKKRSFDLGLFRTAADNIDIKILSGLFPEVSVQVQQFV